MPRTATGNGRTLADNAPEVMLSLVAGTAVPSGLKPSVAKDLRDNKFIFRRGVRLWHLADSLSGQAVRPLLGARQTFPLDGSTDAYL